MQLHSFIFTVIAIVTGLLTGFFGHEYLFTTADIISHIFMNFLSLVSLPIIFLSIVSVATSMSSLSHIKKIGGKVITYTLLTTVAAATVALVLFVTINPVISTLQSTTETFTRDTQSYWNYLLNSIPANIAKPFVENNVIGVLIIALLISLASFSISENQRTALHTVFSGLFAIFMRITTEVIKYIPIAIWAFITLFIRDVQNGLNIQSIGWYLICVVLANLIQACIVLPLFLKLKGVKVRTLFKAMMPALTIAFFTKSSNAALPMAVQSANDRAKLSPQVTQFVFPLCTTINMNGCAAFILITTLFVSMSYGVAFSPAALLMWVVVSTLAAVGNAGVPMGCFFLSSAFLAAMQVPLHIMGVILPFYAFLDALETTINVWSDSCVAAVVDKEMKAPEIVSQPILIEN